MFAQFLSTADVERVRSVFRKLQRHAVVRAWVLTGGLAAEIHRLRFGCEPSIRVLNDVDFIVQSFDSVPETLSRDFLCRHIHPVDPPGKTLAQFVDADNRVRIDVFRACGAILTRTVPVQFPFGVIQVISPEDLTARLTRIVLQIAEGNPVASKHADDLIRLLQTVDPDDVELAWIDHRLPKHPVRFQSACRLALELTSSCDKLLVTPVYSTDIHEPCGRCVPTGQFQLVSAERMVSIMGYC
jgi:hypothetical protein